MWKKYWNSLMYGLGLTSLICVGLSFLFPSAFDVKYMQVCMCIVIFIHGFGFLTYDLRLFSKYIWVRRAIVILFSIVVLISANIAFGTISRDPKKFWLVVGFIVGAEVIVSVFLYYVSDKIEKRNLDAINKKLADETESKTEESS